MNRDRLFGLLTRYPSSRAIFNQYRDTNPALDTPDGATVRCRNLHIYLDIFSDARYVLVGEAAGYAGCRFSGIPFTCEAQLCSPPRHLAWVGGSGLARSSTADRPWVEGSATIVWASLRERSDCLLWNAFPWHPFGDSGPLSNRSPGRELVDGLQVLECLLGRFPSAQPFALGRVAQRALALLGVDASYIRHPAHGGARQFSAGISALGAAGWPQAALAASSLGLQPVDRNATSGMDGT